MRPRTRRLSYRALRHEFLESRSLLAVDVFFLAGGRLVVAGGNATDQATLSVSATGQILLNGSPAKTATLTNTSQILVQLGAGNDAFTLDQTIGRFEPGLGAEADGKSEIEITVNGGGQTGDVINLIGTQEVDRITLGVDGINLNADNDSDIIYGGFARATVNGQGGDDDISGGGSGQTGLPFLLPIANMVGGPGRDTLVGGAGDDIILGGGDADRLDGGDGDDILKGGAGDDLLGDIVFGNVVRGGVDTLDGEAGNDKVQLQGFNETQTITGTFIAATGEYSIDMLSASFTRGDRIKSVTAITIFDGNGNDTIDFSAISAANRASSGLTSLDLNAGIGADTIRGTQGRDTIRGGSGLSTLFGLGGDDEMFAANAGATLNAGAGNDIVHVNLNNNQTIIGGTGTDTLELLTGLTRSFMSGDRIDATNELEFIERSELGGSIVFQGRGREFETLKVTVDDDPTFTPTADINLSALSIADLQALGITSPVIMTGDSGDDNFLGTAGDDLINGGSGNDTLNGSGGNDTIHGDFGNDTIFGANGNDLLFGDDGDDKLFGGNDDDTLDGGAGTNVLDEGPGEGGVVFHGTAGNDVIRISRLVNQAGVPFVAFDLNGVRTLSPYKSGETIIVFGGSGNDEISLDESAAFRWSAEFHGESGNDTLTGSLLHDRLFGGNGNDRLIGGDGRDLLDGGNGDDVLDAGSGDDILTGGAGYDALFSGDGSDVIVTDSDDVFTDASEEDLLTAALSSEPTNKRK